MGCWLRYALCVELENIRTVFVQRCAYHPLSCRINLEVTWMPPHVCEPAQLHVPACETEELVNCLRLAQCTDEWNTPLLTPNVARRPLSLPGTGGQTRSATYATSPSAFSEHSAVNTCSANPSGKVERLCFDVSVPLPSELAFIGGSYHSSAYVQVYAYVYVFT